MSTKSTILPCLDRGPVGLKLTRPGFALALTIGSLLLLAGLSGRVVAADKTLSTAEIFQKARERYALLASYSDEGTTMSRLSGITLITRFTTKMARPNFYKIEWRNETDMGSAYVNSFKQSKTEAVWSAGAGDFMDTAGGGLKKSTREAALTAASGIAGGATAAFFDANSGNLLAGLGAGSKREADERVGGVDCHAFSRGVGVVTTTIWIGKEDFLIHQVRHLFRPPEPKKGAADNTNGASPTRTPHTFTETHTNIVLNAKFTRSDFAP